MNPVTVVLLSFVIVAGVTVLASMALLKLWPVVQRGRLATSAGGSGGGGESILRWSERPASGWQRTVERIGRAVGGSEQTAPSKYRQRLIWAGLHEPRAAVLFIGAKVALAALLGSGYFLYSSFVLLRVVPFSQLLATSLILAGIGFFLPDFWLRNRIKARQREIVHALPDVLDLLMVCVEAGMGFDAAVARVAEQPETRHRPLYAELMRMHLEVRAGRPRQEALRALGERAGVEEVKSMVGAFIQTEKLGTPLGKTLRVHADSARVQRRHRAEELAHLAPLKMLFPTVFFLMPAFFLVTLAPSVLGLLKLFKAIGSH
jgi:tight adherence protein C